MFGDRVICTAVDLVRAARCEFALLRALDTEVGTIQAGPGAAEHLSESSRGFDEHQVRRIADRDRFGDAMVEVNRPPDAVGDPAERIATLTAAHTQTAAALRAGAPVIYDPTFFDGRFDFSCDFLLRADHRVRYTVHGTAHTMPDRVGAAIELAACADALDRAGALSAPLLRLHLGEVSSAHALSELLPVYRARRRRVERILDEKLGELLPVQWGDPRYPACGRCPTCTAALSAARDLLLVAGMPAATRIRLRDAGVSSIDRLAVTEIAVPGVSQRTLTALRRQAEIQLRSEDSGQPTHSLVDAIALGALPPPSPGDLSLTVTGGGRRPLILEVGGPGTVHLSFRGPFGAAGEPDSEATGRRRALEQVLDYLIRRRRMYPDLHIYHYTSAVRTALQHCTGRYGIGEEIVDELLCDGVLVDLYPIVRSAVIVGEQSYRLRSLRRLLPDAAHSPVAERDCLTLLRLRDWLLDRAAEQRIDPQGVTLDRTTSWCAVAGPGDVSPPSSRPSSLEAALTEYAAGQNNPLHAAAMMAAALGYHRRERQPLWWAHVDRLSHPVDEWADAPGVLIAEWGTVDTKWHRRPDRSTMRRYLTLTGRIATSWNGAAGPSALTPGTTVYTFYDRPVAAGMVTAVGRRATATATVLGCSVDAEFDDTVRLEERLPDGCDPYDELPTAIAPGLPAWDENAEMTVEVAAQQLLMTLPDIPREAVFDLLARRPPRLRDEAALPTVHGDHAAAITAAVRDLDRSYIAVQGPSGTGKTSTTARVLERLVTRHKWRIGVVAQEHSTVENLLDAIVRIGVLPELVAKKDVAALAPEWAVIEADRYPRFLANAISGCVIGGTPADFTNEDVVPRACLDLLVVADAGRLPLADTVAVAACARNLLLLGDPIPSAARSAHPAPVGESVLGWLAEGRQTLPAARGYFLDRTWRMHPAVCEPISRLYYDGRLRANETITLARQLDGEEPGVHTVLVDHHGNSTESVAEAREVVRRVRTLLGMSWTIGTTTRRLHPHDIFVVAPYAAQVGQIQTLLARAKIEDVLVGTPDRFRGREAAVVLLSMTTSSPADAPYGMPFLLSRGLILAAMCRAMWKAVIIRSPLLTEYLPAIPDEVADLAGFLRLGGGQPKQTPSPR
ncbi:AAA domain-containing protein [Nocardia sp. NPDC049190]|uniref:AAA domain-containing protein n=1 Tax=Nocardia sp. NPDC049190 TaxID=3155650 RepID=UPI0033F2C641